MSGYVASKYQGKYTITPGIQAMPHVINPAQQGDVSAMIGRFLFPFAVSFLMPLFVHALVKEKEDRIMMMMHMSGLSSKVYYLSHYLHFLLQQWVASVVFIVVGAALQMTFFTRTNPLVYLLLMLLWSHVQVCFAFLLASLFSSSRRALILTYLFVTLSVIVGSMSSVIFQNTVPYAWYIHPSFAMYHALHLITAHASLHHHDPAHFVSGQCQAPVAALMSTHPHWQGKAPRSLPNAQAPSLPTKDRGQTGKEASTSLPAALWLTIPSIAALLGLCQAQATRKHCAHSQMAFLTMPMLPQITDTNALNERKNIMADAYDPQCNVVVKMIEKTFAAGNTAVNDVAFSVQPNIVFGLLGPNGAGKSTLLHMLTGLIAPTSGTAIIAGHDITKEMDRVHCSIGVCPQHDIHWGDLTPMEHMLFYARLRGIPKEHEQAEARRALSEVQLQRQSDQPAHSLSGGEKRRLSIGIALLGNSKVVFLDEPTTGLDPQVRRVIWRIILNAKRHRTVILTTHSMEEADTLCSQIGIMASGALRCIGNQVYLKKEYGSGYRLSLAAAPQKLEVACRFVESILPPSWRRIDRFATTALYEFRSEGSRISEVFLSMQKNKDALGIDDWGLSQTSLEDVFMNIVSNAVDEEPARAHETA
ncbi:P-loop containing nucleoside triphosphate hydrolase protein [Syncephalis pseudoplumigaleata]|uniref:P-loop containing nucleoside triphosphate hydrolase protein n=1 Tax=Syncephalis pseudoplumigaleata TaxID=1712513 RepID=A0A4P9Z1T9_9FUNG|nr:P-loop containing nucleoside triphosphate hydrolase protein [Syncephalis pseudoplumigaleata]|eukprot:RKP26308.1 P-loop containing nucleoside triphosphate hydrolase protein [Syncephalis pseudoplumigaleata]